MSNPGALIPAGLASRVHWTLGRCAEATPEEAVEFGDELVGAIQSEIEKAFRRGVEVTRQTLGGQGASSAGSPDIRYSVTAGAGG